MTDEIASTNAEGGRVADTTEATEQRDDESSESSEPDEAWEDDLPQGEAPRLPPPEGATPLSKRDRVWVDPKKRTVYVDGYVSLREGVLEMFACTEGTKEHESIIAVQSKAHLVHTALLAVGAKPGHPVRYQPKFQPPAGTEIDIEVRWILSDGSWERARAQDWVRNADTKKPMELPFVFAGSVMLKDDETGKNYYLAEGGDLICVSNFGSAMLDVPIESSQSNDGLLFEADSERVPALGVPVRLVLTPKEPGLPARDAAFSDP